MTTVPTPTTAPVQPPDLFALLANVQRNVMTQFNCALPGIVDRVNYERQTVEIKLAVKRVVDNDTKEYPLLVDCPFFILGGSRSGGSITIPVAQGDTCLVIFCDRSIDTWWKTGAIDKPSNPRVHSLADGIALIGIRSLGNLISDFLTYGIELRHFGIYLTGNVNVSTGATDTFTTADGATVTVINGIVTNISR